METIKTANLKNTNRLIYMKKSTDNPNRGVKMVNLKKQCTYENWETYGKMKELYSQTVNLNGKNHRENKSRFSNEKKW